MNFILCLLRDCCLCGALGACLLDQPKEISSLADGGLEDTQSWRVLAGIPRKECQEIQAGLQRFLGGKIQKKEETLRGRQTQSSTEDAHARTHTHSAKVRSEVCCM